MNIEKLIEKYKEIKKNFKKINFYEMELNIEEIKTEFGTLMEEDICSMLDVSKVTLYHYLKTYNPEIDEKDVKSD